MPAVAASTPTSSPRPSATAKMEDRKRPAISSTDDLAPPSKRQAVNGNKATATIKENALMELREESWIEKFQKGAIYREMQEYSRKADIFESRLEELHKRSMHHNDHLRLIDAWWHQVLEEIELLTDSTIPIPAAPSDPAYLTRVRFDELSDFQHHLEDRGKSICSRAQVLITRVAGSRGHVRPDVAEWESKTAALLAEQKDLQLRLGRVQDDKEQLVENLDQATARYLKAEKKLDRAKSAQVQALEQQAMATSTRSPKPGDPNSDAAETNGNHAEMTLQYQEASAAAAKRKEQLDSALGEIRALMDENTGLRTRREIMADEDLIRTDIFKQVKAQNEDLIRRINNLEATNRQLRDESDKLLTERTEFRSQVEQEANSFTQELQADVANERNEVVRLRAHRDECFNEARSLKAARDLERSSIEELKGLVEHRDHRIIALESELERFRSREEPSAPDPGLDDLTMAELRARYGKVQRDYDMMLAEANSMEQAYRKASGVAHKKVMDLVAAERKIAALAAEKGKADNKYFAAQSNNDTKQQEIKDLRRQNSRTGEIITQLKEVEAHNRTLLANLEKQLVDVKRTNSAISAEHRRMELVSFEAARRADMLKAQVAELASVVKSRDSTVAALRERDSNQEVDLDRLKVRVDHLQRDRDSWKTKALSNSSEEEALLRMYALCSICRNNFKNTALKTCGHLFCKDCLDSRLTNRMRKCPTCSRAFDKMDIMPVHH